MLLNCSVGDDSWESLGLQEDQTNTSSRISVLDFHWKDWCWSWSSNTLATWCKELTHWKRPWYWERLKVGREGENRGWDGWMASSTHWTWVWASSGSWWWTMKPDMLQSIGSQSQTWLSDWTELNWTDDKYTSHKFSFSFSKTLKLFYPWFESQLCSFVVNLLILILNEKIGYEDWCLEGILKNGACVKLLPQKQEGSHRVGCGGVTYHWQWGGKPG